TSQPPLAASAYAPPLLVSGERQFTHGRLAPDALRQRYGPERVTDDLPEQVTLLQRIYPLAREERPVSRHGYDQGVFVVYAPALAVLPLRVVLPCVVQAMRLGAHREHPQTQLAVVDEAGVVQQRRRVAALEVLRFVHTRTQSVAGLVTLCEVEV